MRRVVITGMGVISSLGSDVPAVLDSLRNGRSGIELVPERKELGFRSALAGTIKDYEMPALTKPQLRGLNRSGRLAVATVAQALANAGLCAEDIANERTGVLVGTTGHMEEIYQLIHAKQSTKKNITIMALAKTMVSTVSANLSVIYKTRGHCMTVGAACASGASAIAQGAQAIQLGLQDCIIAGGVQEGTWEYDILFESLRVFSSREDQPTQASRPFDKQRDGLVPSGGCGFVILEDHERAAKRGATMLAELIGHATNADGHDMTTPSGEGSVRCMKMALGNAGVNADSVDYVNAHATATPVGDAAEARGIAEVFGERPYVSSTKSMTGHEIGAAGCTELIYTLLMMQHGFIAPNTNLDEVSDDCRGIRIVANEAIDAKPTTCVSNSFGFGGVNTVLVVRRAE